MIKILEGCLMKQKKMKKMNKSAILLAARKSLQKQQAMDCRINRNIRARDQACANSGIFGGYLWTNFRLRLKRMSP